MGPVIHQIYFKRIPRFKTCKTDLKSDLKFKTDNRVKRKENRTKKIGKSVPGRSPASQPSNTRV
jgi:hypothetical protein